MSRVINALFQIGGADGQARKKQQKKGAKDGFHHGKFKTLGAAAASTLFPGRPSKKADNLLNLRKMYLISNKLKKMSFLGNYLGPSGL
jgi:hypothetical protein